jgi:hypothetical protein
MQPMSDNMRLTNLSYFHCDPLFINTNLLFFHTITIQFYAHAETQEKLSIDITLLLAQLQEKTTILMKNHQTVPII